MALHPPRLAERLLRIAFREPELRETVLGDLCEDFLDRAERSVWRARIWYWKEAAAICLSVTVRRQLARLVDGGNGFLLRGRLMGGFVNDLRQAARTFRRHPATALLVVLTLGIGIGSSSAVFSILKRALVPAYPFEEPDRLVVLETYDGTTSSRLSVPDLIRIRDQVGTMSRTAGYRTRSYTLVGQNLPERVTAAHVTSGFFALLGVQTSGTADFEPIDDAPGGPRRGLLSASAAIRLFGSVDGALGGALTLDGESYEVAGVLPSDFWFPDDVEVWLPAGLDEAFVESSETRLIYRAIGRMEQGVEPRAVMDELMALDGVDRAGDVRITATPLRRWLVGDAELVLMLLQVASGLLLLLGLTNATGMILALSFDRARERAVRVALGARVPDLLRATLAEGLTLSLAGGAVGLTLAFGAVQVLTSLVPADIVGPAEVGIDAMTVTVAFVAALVTGVVMSFLPGLRAVRGSDPAAAVRSWRTRPKEERRFQHAFLSVQVGLGLALTLAAVSLSRSLLSLAGNDVGFQEEGILTMRLSLPSDRYADASAIADFFDRVSENVGRIPGVERAGVTLALPFSGTDIATPVEVTTASGGPQAVETHFRTVTKDYFTTLEIPLIEGRRPASGFDGAGIREALVSEAFARQVEGSVLGAVVQMSPGQDGRFVVTGVVGDVRHFGLGRAPEPEIYLGYRAYAMSWGYLVARTASEPSTVVAAVRQTVADLDPAQPVYDVRTLSERIGGSTRPQRLVTLLVLFFSSSALLILASGTYGVVAGHAARMTRELGVRAALGARRRSLLAHTALRPGRSVLGGVLLGAWGTWIAADRPVALLLGQWSLDAMSLFVACAVILSTATLGALGPARRAARLDPVRSLSVE
jgi:putative ABC transport system permease protein